MQAAKQAVAGLAVEVAPAEVERAEEAPVAEDQAGAGAACFRSS